MVRFIRNFKLHICYRASEIKIFKAVTGLSVGSRVVFRLVRVRSGPLEAREKINSKEDGCE